MAEQWYTEFGAEFWLVISGSMFAFLGLALRACLKSRCSNIKVCWGMWECEREPVADEFVSDLDSIATSPKSVSLKMEEGIN